MLISHFNEFEHESRLAREAHTHTPVSGEDKPAGRNLDPREKIIYRIQLFLSL